MADPRAVEAVFAALKVLADRDVPLWERGAISDKLLREVAGAAVDAIDKFRGEQNKETTL